MEWFLMSDNAVLIELGKRLKEYRFQKNFTQKDLAAQIGVSVFTITQLESGKAVSVNTFIAVLRAYRLLDNLELLLPNPMISPVKILEFKKNTPQQRVYKKRSKALK